MHGYIGVCLEENFEFFDVKVNPKYKRNTRFKIGLFTAIITTVKKPRSKVEMKGGIWYRVFECNVCTEPQKAINTPRIYHHDTKITRKVILCRQSGRYPRLATNPKPPIRLRLFLGIYIHNRHAEA